MSNTRIWDQVETTDPSATKNFTGMGGFKGTAIKPTYLMHKATQVFGPCGEGWGWVVLDDRFDQGAPLQMPTKEWPDAPTVFAKLHTVKLELWYLGKDGQRCTIQQYGHTPFVYLQGGKIITDWEAAKKSTTDAISKCLQPLGFAADIHMGMFDDSSYVEALRDEVEIEKAEDKVAEEERQKQERLDYIKSVIDTMAGAQSSRELKQIHDVAARKLVARRDNSAVTRITREYEERKPRFDKPADEAAQ
uniref:DNA repair protein n=3 Tax=unclassified bacterial viruses TaxID=12333 RepID=A0AAU6W3M9_9VIRU